MSTQQLLRPNSTWHFDQVGFHGPGATTFWGAISDETDTTFVQSNANNQRLIVGFTNLSLTPDQRINGVTIWSRSARDVSAGYTQDATLKLYLEKHFNYAAGTYTIQRGTNEIFGLHGPQSNSPPHSSREWTVDALNHTGCQITWHPVGTGADGWVKIFGVWLVVEIITRATIDVPVVTDYVDNATPTINWNFTDPDGGRQRAFQVRVFKQSVVSAEGFNPATSDAAWDSGIVDNAATIATARVPLHNGVTYVAYVRAAKHGPELALGTPYWWTTWRHSDAFTINFIKPLTPVIQSAAVVADDNIYRAMFSVFTPVNLLTANVASLTNTSGTWRPQDIHTTIMRDTGTYLDFDASLRLTTSGTPTSMGAYADLNPNGGPFVTTGPTYTFLAHFLAGAGPGRQCQVGVTWVAHDGVTPVSTVYGSIVTSNAFTWTIATLQATPPAGAERALVRVLVTPTSGTLPDGSIHYVDKVSVHAGTSSTWTPGGYANSLTGLAIERAEMINDARGRSQNWLQESVASAASDTRDPTYGFSWDVTNAQVVWQWLDRRIGAPGSTPAGSLRWTPYATDAALIVGAMLNGEDVDCLVAAAPGTTYTFSYWAWTGTGTCTINPAIQWCDQDGSVLSTDGGSGVVLTTTPQRLTTTSVAPTGAVFCSGKVHAQSAVGTHIFVTRFGLGAGLHPVDGQQGMGQPLEWQLVNFTGNADLLTAEPDPLGKLTGQVEVLPDFEYIPGVPLVYRAQVGYAVDSNVLGSDYSNYVTVYSPPPTRTIIRSFVDPTISVVVNRRQAMSLQVTEDASIYHPLGADGATVRVRDWVGGEDGSLDVITGSDAQSLRLRRLLSCGDVVQVLWAQGGRTYALLTGVQQAEITSGLVNVCDVDGVAVGGLRYAVTTLTYLETVWPGTLIANTLGEFLLAGGLISSNETYVVYSFDGTASSPQDLVTVSDFDGNTSHQPFLVNGF